MNLLQRLFSTLKKADVCHLHKLKYKKKLYFIEKKSEEIRPGHRALPVPIANGWAAGSLRTYRLWNLRTDLV